MPPFQGYFSFVGFLLFTPPSCTSMVLVYLHGFGRQLCVGVLAPEFKEESSPAGLAIVHDNGWRHAGE